MIYFIAGMLFAAAALPIVDGMVSVALSFMEVLKGKCAVKVAEYNYQISKMDDEPTQETHVIGFQVPTEEDDYEDD